MKTNKYLLSVLAVSPLLTLSNNSFAVDLLPNLQPKPPYELSLFKNTQNNLFLRFSALTWNSGSGPLRVEGRAIDPVNGTQLVQQRIFRNDGTSYLRDAGYFIYHDHHGHIHLQDYAQYMLQSVDPNGPSVAGAKTSFCILDTDKINTQLSGAPKRAVYYTCESTTQGMSVGWGDAYRSYLEGQALDITNIPSGDYYLIINTDPNNVLLESNENHNQSSIKLNINKEALTYTILDGSSPSDPPPPSGNVVIDGIHPNTITAGGSGTYEIMGVGFTNGIKVSIANGSGPAPIVSNVRVDASGTKITATITAKKGGQPTSVRYWDVVVGSAVCPDCFLLFP